MPVLSDDAELIGWMGAAASGMMLGWLQFERQSVRWRIIAVSTPCYGALCELVGPPGTSAMHFYGAAVGAVIALLLRKAHV